MVQPSDEGGQRDGPGLDRTGAAGQPSFLDALIKFEKVLAQEEHRREAAERSPRDLAWTSDVVRATVNRLNERPPFLASASNALGLVALAQRGALVRAGDGSAEWGTSGRWKSRHDTNGQHRRLPWSPSGTGSHDPALGEWVNVSVMHHGRCFCDERSGVERKTQLKRNHDVRYGDSFLWAVREGKRGEGAGHSDSGTDRVEGAGCAYRISRENVRTVLMRALQEAQVGSLFDATLGSQCDEAAIMNAPSSAALMLHNNLTLCGSHMLVRGGPRAARGPPFSPFVPPGVVLGGTRLSRGSAWTNPVPRRAGIMGQGLRGNGSLHERAAMVDGCGAVALDAPYHEARDSYNLWQWRSHLLAPLKTRIFMPTLSWTAFFVDHYVVGVRPLLVGGQGRKGKDAADGEDSETADQIARRTWTRSRLQGTGEDRGPLCKSMWDMVPIRKVAVPTIWSCAIDASGVGRIGGTFTRGGRLFSLSSTVRLWTFPSVAGGRLMAGTSATELLRSASQVSGDGSGDAHGVGGGSSPVPPEDVFSVQGLFMSRNRLLQARYLSAGGSCTWVSYSQRARLQERLVKSVFQGIFDIGGRGSPSGAHDVSDMSAQDNARAQGVWAVLNLFYSHDADPFVADGGIALESNDLRQTESGDSAVVGQLLGLRGSRSSDVCVATTATKTEDDVLIDKTDRRGLYWGLETFYSADQKMAHGAWFWSIVMERSLAGLEFNEHVYELPTVTMFATKSRTEYKAGLSPHGWLHLRASTHVYDALESSDLVRGGSPCDEVMYTAARHVPRIFADIALDHNFFSYDEVLSGTLSFVGAPRSLDPTRSGLSGVVYTPTVQISMSSASGCAAMFRVDRTSPRKSKTGTRKPQDANKNKPSAQRTSSLCITAFFPMWGAPRVPAAGMQAFRIPGAASRGPAADAEAIRGLPHHGLLRQAHKLHLSVEFSFS